MQEIILSNEKITLGVLPELGASLSFLSYHKDNQEVPILRKASLKKKKLNSNEMALFPMLPYCGRIRGGRFTYWGILRKLPKTQREIPDPIHGDGWKSAWQIKEQTKTSLVLVLSHDKQAGGFPFSYEAELHYELINQEFKITITLKNSSVLPMPCGVGVHPFFIKDKDVQLEFNAGTVWSNEFDPIWGNPYSVPNDWSFAQEKALGDAVFDTCFGEFDGRAKVHYPSKGITVEMEAGSMFRHVVLFSPKGKNFFCLEPCTNASDAFNLAADGVIGTGIRSIGPNQSITETINFKIKG